MVYRSSQGFTLVELIVVILLIAIVSAYAASRYIGVGSFSAFAAQEQMISVIRQVQVNRMQSNLGDSSANTNFILSIGNQCVGSLAACSSGSHESRSDLVRIPELSFSATPNLSTVTFDLLGNPEGAASGGINILLTASDSQARVCVNSQGYVSRGVCL